MRELPEPLAAIGNRIKAMFFRRRLDQDIDEELQFHLAMREQRLREAGAGDAREAARRRFGNLMHTMEACRDMWTFVRIETLWRDTKFGLRQWRQRPGFTAAAILALALGIGATTAIFSMCDALIWNTTELPAMEDLVAVLQAAPENPHLWNLAAPADIEDIQRGSSTLGSMASWTYGTVNLVAPGREPARVDQARVTSNLFEVLGVRPSLGRTFLPGEDQPGRERVVVLSNRLWRSRFSANPKILGTEVRLSDRTYTVIGVMPPSFAFPRANHELWTPLALTEEERRSRSALMVESVARMKSGRPPAQFTAELTALGKRLERLYPKTNTGRHFLAWPIKRYLVGDYAVQFGRMLFGAAVFVLLIACVNVANLQLARITGRGTEIAVRTALGASRRRIMLQFLIESTVLAFGAAALGVVGARWALAAIRMGMPAELQRYSRGWSEMGLDSRALLFAIAVAALSGILTGTAPAWRCSRPKLTESLKEGGRGTSGTRGRTRLRSTFIAAQLALAMVLLVGAGLMIRGFQTLVRSKSSFEPANALTLRLEITEDKYREGHQATRFYHDVLEQIRTLPGVQAAAVATGAPYSRHMTFAPLMPEGGRTGLPETRSAQVQTVSEGYFQILHIPLRAGRLPSERDAAASPRVAVINERSARQWWTNTSTPIGRRFRLGENQPWLTVVGVVGDVEASVLERTPPPVVYVPDTQNPQWAMDVVIRSAGEPMRLVPGIRAAVRAVDPEQPISAMLTLERLRQDEAITLTYSGALMGVMGAIGLVLSLAGVSGLTAYLVSEQTHEIGIRLALGASRGGVLAMVFRRSMPAAVAGLAAGILLAALLARVLASIIWGVNPHDAVAFAVMPMALALAVAVAIYCPARTATRIEPLLALRHE